MKIMAGTRSRVIKLDSRNHIMPLGIIKTAHYKKIQLMANVFCQTITLLTTFINYYVISS